MIFNIIPSRAVFKSPLTRAALSAIGRAKKQFFFNNYPQTAYEVVCLLKKLVSRGGNDDYD
jgi:hypothetical protein